jgi:hypothetical protein
MTLLGLLLANNVHAQPQKHALLIGLNEYRHRAEGIIQLEYADNDVRELKRSLESYGFKVKCLVNDDAKRADIIAEIYNYEQILSKDDTFLIFFAGHGVRNPRISKNTYWLTYDTRLSLLDEAGIRLKHLLDYVRDIKADRKLVLLDHCFSGDVVSSAFETTADAAAERRVSPGPLHIVRGVISVDDLNEQIKNQAEGLIIIAAAKMAALESAKLKHGVFTAALLKAFQSRVADTSGEGNLSVSELLDFLPKELSRVAQREAIAEQRISSFVYGRNITSWEILGPLPLGNLQKARERKRRYEETLLRWVNSGWISALEIQVPCMDVLEKYIRTFDGGEELNERDNQIFELLKRYIDSPGPERGRASSLAVAMRDVMKSN